MKKDTLEKWVQLRQEAYQQAKINGVGPQKIAKQVGTSQTNVINIIKRGSHTSTFAAPIDAVLKKAVPEYDQKLSDLLEEDSRADPPTEIGNLLLAHARLLRDPGQSVEFKMDTIQHIVSTLQSFLKNEARKRPKTADRK